MQLSAESRQPSLVGGREHVEAHWEEAQKEQSEAEKQAAAIEKVKEHHARMEQLRKYKVAVDQMIHEETAATQKDKRSAGIPSGVVEPPVVNLANDGFAVEVDRNKAAIAALPLLKAAFAPESSTTFYRAKLAIWPLPAPLPQRAARRRSSSRRRRRRG